jgi:3',5'-cyclic-AMP phosphodiesterase
VSALVVAQISDTHLRRVPSDPAEDASPDATLARTVAGLVAHAPDMVLLTGDICDDGSVEGCERAKAIISRLGVPILATPGNHDVAGVVASVFGGAASMTWSAVTTGPDRVARSYGWEVMVADTAVPGQEAGRIDVDALADRLAPSGDRPVLLALHHPPISRSTHPWFQLDGATELVTLLAGLPNVRAVVSGHLHEAFDVHIGHVSYIGCPSSWYGIAHDGSTWAKDPTGLVGAHLLHLTSTGHITVRPIPRPF